MKERNYLLKRKHVKTRAWEELTRITVISSCKLNIKFITQSALSLSLSLSILPRSDEEEDENYLCVRAATVDLADSISNLSFASSNTGLLTPEPSPDITSDMFGMLCSSSEQISFSSSASQTNTNTSTSNSNRMYLEIPPLLPNCGQVSWCLLISSIDN